MGLRTEQAVPLGLIANELVTNALKHAFPGDRSGTIRVVLRASSSVSFIVEDNIGEGGVAGLATDMASDGTAWGQVICEDALSGCRARLEFLS